MNTLEEAIAVEVRALYAEGWTANEIAEVLGVPTSL
jgi:DNA-directed RNA polymerase specialized sigma24 family protein